MRSAKRRVYDILAALVTASAACVATVARAQTPTPAHPPAPAQSPVPAPLILPDPPAYHPLGDWLRANVPPELREVGFLLEHWQWLGLLAAVLLGILVGRLAAMIAVSIGRRVFQRIVPSGDVGVIKRGGGAIGLVLGAAVARAAFFGLRLPKAFMDPLSVATRFLAATALVLTAYRLVDIFMAHLMERARRTPSRSDDVLVPLLRKSIKVVVIAFGFVFVADNLNVGISSLLAGLGLGGLALALAAQDTVKNLFGSITVLLDRPFQVDDAVIIGSVEGTVEEVGLRSTRIRTAGDSMITVPNANLISTNVENLGARRWRRWLTRIRVGYDTPPETIEAFCEGIRELIRQQEDTRKEGFDVCANEFGPSAIEIVLSVFFRSTTSSAELAARHQLLLGIVRLATRLGISFAYPVQTVHLFRPGEPADAASLEDLPARPPKPAALITRMPESPS